MLKNTIQSDLIDAIKARKSTEVSTLKLLKSEIMKHEVSGKDAVATDEVVLTIVKREIKKRKDAITMYEQAGRTEQANQEQAELEVLMNYMPEQLDESAVEQVVQNVLSNFDGATMQDFGKVMGSAMGKLNGKADGSLVQSVVKKLLQG